MPSWLLKYGPTVILVLLIAGAGWWLRDLLADNAQLRTEKVDLQDRLALRDAQLKQAARIRTIDNEYRAEVAADEKEAQQLQQDLQELGGADEPLSDYLRAVSDRVYP